VFKTFYSKLAATLAVLFILLGVMFFLLLRAAFEMQEEAINQELHRDLAARLVAEHAGAAGAAAAEALDQQLFTNVMRVNPTVEAYRLDANGAIVAHAAPAGRVQLKQVSLTPLLTFLRGEARFPLRGDDPRHPGKKAVFSVAPIGGREQPSGYLYLILTGEERAVAARQWTANTTLRFTGWVMAAGLVFALVAGFVVFNLLTARLGQLASAMAAFRRDGFGERTSYVAARAEGAGDEIDELGRTYNEMADRILRQLAELRAVDATRRDLIANVSHDLRTPLASLRGYLDTVLLKYDTLSEAERKQYLDTAARQSEQLSKLITDLFDLAKLDAHDVRPQPEPFSLSELAHDVVQSAELGASEKGVKVVADTPSGIPFVFGDIGLVERVLQNLLTNAVRHTQRGGSVKVSLAEDGGRVRAEVSDTGHGIPPEALEKIFDRFYTLDKSRSSPGGGTGLGLAIAKRIVELHGSELRVDSLVGMGTRFWFSIAVAPRGE
jgi:signal transduction histidine kinase